MVPDYPFYRGIYRGQLLEQQDFQRLVPDAMCYLERITLGRSPRAQGRTALALGKAACAAAERLYLMESARQRQGIASETVGKHTVSYQAGSQTDRGELYQAAAFYLEGTGLLYRGI